MSDFDRGKFYPKKKIQQRENANNSARSFFNSKSGHSRHEKDLKDSEGVSIKQPTILIKTREPTEDNTSSPKRIHKDSETQQISLQTANRERDDVTNNPVSKTMTKSMKLVDDGILFNESLQDYVQENNEFLVVGVVGAQGVGKSTILNLLAQNSVTDNLKKELFKSYNDTEESIKEAIKILRQGISDIKISKDTSKDNETSGKVFNIERAEDIENNLHTTQGIDIFITSNRVILLDCQPFMSLSVLDELIHCENKRSSIVSEFIPLENSGEIQGLQLTAFMMSVCHILIVVQDWFLDSNVVRYIQTAEMLKPTMTNPEDEASDFYPHLLLLHNKAVMDDFSPLKFKKMQDVYKQLFNKTKLHIESKLGLGTGRVIQTLCPQNCGSPINLFLIPDYQYENESEYKGHPSLEMLIKRMKANIMGSTKNSMTHFQLSEKTWLAYCVKVWDTVKKSPFFVEYTKLMP